MLSEWQDLLKQIEIVDGTNGQTADEGFLRPITEEEILEFETKTKIILGPGSVGENTINIYAPIRNFANQNQYELEARTKFDKDMISLHLDNYDFWKNTQEGQNLKSLERLTQNVLFFASNSSSCSFFWDLETYSCDELSYDIYGVTFGSFSTYLFGRDFLAFVRDFGFRMKDYGEIPGDFHPMYYEEDTESKVFIPSNYFDDRPPETEP
jgi:hypothetical protein